MCASDIHNGRISWNCHLNWTIHFECSDNNHVGRRHTEWPHSAFKRSFATTGTACSWTQWRTRRVRNEIIIRWWIKLIKMYRTTFYLWAIGWWTLWKFLKDIPIQRRYFFGWAAPLVYSHYVFFTQDILIWLF